MPLPGRLRKKIVLCVCQAVRMCMQFADFRDPALGARPHATIYLYKDEIIESQKAYPLKDTDTRTGKCNSI